MDNEWGFSKSFEDLDNWPKDEDGEMIPPAFLSHMSGTQMEAEIQINLLRAYGIPIVTCYPNDGSFGKIIIGVSGTGIEIYVPETMLEDAQNIINGDIVEDGEDFDFEGEGEGEYLEEYSDYEDALEDDDEEDDDEEDSDDGEDDE